MNTKVQACIRLAEAIPVDRHNYLVLNELLDTLHKLNTPEKTK